MKSGKITQIIICLTVAAAILVPAVTLFNAGDYLWCSFYSPDSRRMLTEVLILAAVTAAVCIFVKKRSLRIGIMGATALVFIYIHSMLLPAFAGAVYFLAVLSMGGIVTGMSVVIIIEGILSLAGLGTPAVLGIAVMAVSVLYTLYIILVRKERPPVLRIFRHGDRQGDPNRDRHPDRVIFDLSEKTPGFLILVNAVVFLVILVQIGKAPAAAADYDSLWYGLRSEHVLAPGGSIFEDLGLVGTVYTYSKGYETVTLPLSPFDSYAYVPVFNICLFVTGLAVTWKTVRKLVGTRIAASYHVWAGLAVMITAVIPGITNMCIPAKPDMATWLLQLIMTERFFGFVGAQSRERPGIFFEILAAFLLSLTMKPTAVIFSTALAGMMLIWWIADTVHRRRKAAAGNHDGGTNVTTASNYGHSDGTGSTDAETDVPGSAADAGRYGTRPAAVFSAAAAFTSLCLVWARTVKLTGVPFTSVFTGILTALGFRLKYPFVSKNIPHTWQDESAVKVMAKRIIRMLLSPEGEDMGHVSIAWCGSIMLVLGVIIIICIIKLIINSRTAATRARAAAGDTAGTVYARAAAGDTAGTAYARTAAADAADIVYADAGNRINAVCAGTVSCSSAPAVHIGAASRRFMIAAAVVFIPYALLSAATLAMLAQVDGNYYMTFYSIVIISAMWLAGECGIYVPEGSTQPGGMAAAMTGRMHDRMTIEIPGRAPGEIPGRAPEGTPGRAPEGTPGRTPEGIPGEMPVGKMPAAADTPAARARRSEKIIYGAAAGLMLAFQFLIMMLTGWSSAAGFAPMALDRLYYDNEAQNRAAMTAQADPQDAASGDTIYDLLAAQPEARVMAMGEHPACLQFKCVVQSYTDVATQWGNKELVKNVDAFIDYLHFAGVDYIYAEDAYLQHEGWQTQILEEMDARGLLYDYIYEGGNFLARVRQQPGLAAQ